MPNSLNYANWAWNQSGQRRVTLSNERLGEFPFLFISRYKPDSHQLVKSVWGRKAVAKGFLSLRSAFHGGCEAIKVDLLCFAPARDENTLWARREGSWDSQKDYLELESWDVPRTKSLLTCSSYEQPLIKWWSFMSCGIHWALALRERAPLASRVPGATRMQKVSRWLFLNVD